MNARTTKTPTTYEISKPTKIEIKTKTDTSKASPKLPANNRTPVEKPKPRTHLREAKNPTHVSYPKGGKNNLRRIGIETPLKVTRPRLVQNTRLADNPIGPRGQTVLGKGIPALQGHTASTSRVGFSNPTDIQSRLKRKSPWFSAIMDPISGGGVRIPDAVGTHTSTYQHVQNVSVPVNTHGVAGLRIISPYINNYIYGGPDGDGSNFQTTTSSSTTAGILWGNTVATPGQGAFAFSDVPAILKANAQSHRVVSASVLAQPEVSTLNDAGEMCAFVKPFDCNDSDVSYPTLQKQWDSSMMPINRHKSMISRWYPLSSDFQQFNTVESVQDGSNEPSMISYQDFIDPNYKSTTELALDGVIPYEVGVVCSGMNPSTGIVRFTIVVNYEFIPKTQTTMIPSSPSPIDPTEEQLVNSWVADCPVTAPVSDNVAAKTAQASTVSEKSEPSGFGMIFNVVEEMMPLIKAGAKLLA